MIGGLARVDVLQSPGATLYLSVFASDEIGCHLGKTEGAEERWVGRPAGRPLPACLPACSAGRRRCGRSLALGSVTSLTDALKKCMPLP